MKQLLIALFMVSTAYAGEAPLESVVQVKAKAPAQVTVPTCLRATGQKGVYVVVPGPCTPPPPPPAPFCKTHAC